MFLNTSLVLVNQSAITRECLYMEAFECFFLYIACNQVHQGICFWLYLGVKGWLDRNNNDSRIVGATNTKAKKSKHKNISNNIVIFHT